MKYVKYGKCVKCGKTYEATPDLTTCECGGILDIVYDYEAIRGVLTRETLAKRAERSMWRYWELLPVEETTAPPPLRVGWSPLYEEPRLAEDPGPEKAVGQGRRPEPHRLPEGPGQFHGRGQGPGGGRARSSPAPPRAMPLRPWRATPRRRASKPTSSCPPGRPRGRWPSCRSSAPPSSPSRAAMRTPSS